jgi:hypothetical protein
MGQVLMSPLPGLKKYSISRFTHGWRRGLHDDARYAGFRTRRGRNLAANGFPLYNCGPALE